MMDILNTIGWWVSLTIVAIFGLLVLGAIWCGISLKVRKVRERILDFLAKPENRSGVTGKDIWDALGLGMAETYTTLESLEDEGEVTSEQRDDRVINGVRYPRRYYKLCANGTRIKDHHSVDVYQGAFVGA